MRAKPVTMCAALILIAATGCARSGSGPAPDPCPEWLSLVAPILLPAEPQDRALEDDVIALNEAGQRVGCW